MRDLATSGFSGQESTSLKHAELGPVVGFPLPLWWPGLLWSALSLELKALPCPALPYLTPPSSLPFSHWKHLVGVMHPQDQGCWEAVLLPGLDASLHLRRVQF
jgi:hypothetical protein